MADVVELPHDILPVGAVTALAPSGIKVCTNKANNTAKAKLLTEVWRLLICEFTDIAIYYTLFG